MITMADGLGSQNLTEDFVLNILEAGKFLNFIHPENAHQTVWDVPHYFSEVSKK